MFANTQAPCVEFAFPNVCKTPPAAVPLPFPSIGLGTAGAPPVPKILMGGAPAHNLGTSISLTSGDEPGAMLGAVSQTIKAAARYTTGAFTIILCGLPAARMTSTTMSNMVNAPPGASIAPSQVKVLLLAP